MAKTYGNAEEGAIPPRIVSLKRTGYMTVRVPPGLVEEEGTNGSSSIYKSPTQKSRLRLRVPRVAMSRFWRRRRLVQLRELGAPIPVFLLFHYFQHLGEKRCLFFRLHTHSHGPLRGVHGVLFRRGAYVCNILISRWLNGFVFLDCGFLFHATAVQAGRNGKMEMGTYCLLLLLLLKIPCPSRMMDIMSPRGGIYR